MIVVDLLSCVSFDSSGSGVFFPGFVNAESSSRSHTERIGRSWLVLPCNFPDEPAVDDPQF